MAMIGERLPGERLNKSSDWAGLLIGAVSLGLLRLLYVALRDTDDPKRAAEMNVRIG
ncbi:MAG TPA: hypothetical protein VN622_10070 [Clostridia bacterium]|nr:hypothetical protein [Clostridia bacterium]